MAKAGKAAPLIRSGKLTFIQYDDNIWQAIVMLYIMEPPAFPWEDECISSWFPEFCHNVSAQSIVNMVFDAAWQPIHDNVSIISLVSSVRET